MELAIEKPLRYPWENEGWKKILVGGIISMAGGTISLGVTYAVMLLFLPIGAIMANPEAAESLMNESTMAIAQIATIVIGFLINLAYMPFLLGYFWETIAQAKGQGENYPTLPDWSGNWGHYFSVGFKLSLYYYLVFSPVFFLNILIQAGSAFAETNPVLAIISGLGGPLILFGLYGLYIFLMPFLLVPLYYNSPNATLSDMFNVKLMLEMGKKHYGDVILTFIVLILIQMVFGIAGIVFGCVTCCIGFLLFPFFSFGVMISNGLMLLHAYNLDKPDNLLEN
jgi:hypothetical protein